MFLNVYDLTATVDSNWLRKKWRHCVTAEEDAAPGRIAWMELGIEVETVHALLFNKFSL
jgi:hypothetical protein